PVAARDARAIVDGCGRAVVDSARVRAAGDGRLARAIVEVHDAGVVQRGRIRAAVHDRDARSIVDIGIDVVVQRVDIGAARIVAGAGGRGEGVVVTRGGIGAALEGIREVIRGVVVRRAGIDAHVVLARAVVGAGRGIEVDGERVGAAGVHARAVVDVGVRVVV